MVEVICHQIRRKQRERICVKEKEEMLFLIVSAFQVVFLGAGIWLTIEVVGEYYTISKIENCTMISTTGESVDNISPIFWKNEQPVVEEKRRKRLHWLKTYLLTSEKQMELVRDLYSLGFISLLSLGTISWVHFLNLWIIILFVFVLCERYLVYFYATYKAVRKGGQLPSLNFQNLNKKEVIWKNIENLTSYIILIMFLRP